MSEAQNDRRFELIERKHLTGLTEAETAELDRLNRELDEEFAPFYRDAIERLEAAVARLEKTEEKQPQ